MFALSVWSNTGAPLILIDVTLPIANYARWRPHEADALFLAPAESRLPRDVEHLTDFLLREISPLYLCAHLFNLPYTKLRHSHDC